MTRKQPYLAHSGTRIIATSPSRSTYLEAKNIDFAVPHTFLCFYYPIGYHSLPDSRTTQSFGLRCSASFNVSSTQAPAFTGIADKPRREGRVSRTTHWDLRNVCSSM
ncbi:hypothetical protein COCC4DRAFT_58729 [Bipolaris maydis ATCC 48331]|uniref:Uncharacterized protein n=2 Tax=Cochliobolus heterostrophus TaxID=5016 RepID=M2UIZ1_COCH5|nr:uncharacterized protein COCC4DRAFT_58729 [Bipolaris maydis ATCC 48331]EMD93646.1 hypothetical protein COCHEDRAFT_1212336 [Bipolaris maydis C5]ENI06909.1 hypothetical protein COCC4DRAFT_58729 [Bipolaris maydis ATCC 48331]KAH7562549.1 hypothetical protein BM1_02069 [Bipolaris maydis]